MSLNLYVLGEGKQGIGRTKDNWLRLWCGTEQEGRHQALVGRKGGESRNTLDKAERKCSIELTNALHFRNPIWTKYWIKLSDYNLSQSSEQSWWGSFWGRVSGILTLLISHERRRGGEREGRVQERRGRGENGALTSIVKEISTDKNSAEPTSRSVPSGPPRTLRETIPKAKRIKNWKKVYLGLGL